MTTNGIETVDFEDVLDMMMLPLTYAHHPLPVDQPPMTADGWPETPKALPSSAKRPSASS